MARCAAPEHPRPATRQRARSSSRVGAPLTRRGAGLVAVSSAGAAVHRVLLRTRALRFLRVFMPADPPQRMPLFQAFTSLFGGGAQKRMDKETFSLPTTSGSTKYDLGLVRVLFIPSLPMELMAVARQPRLRLGPARPPPHATDTKSADCPASDVGFVCSGLHTGTCSRVASSESERCAENTACFAFHCSTCSHAM